MANAEVGELIQDFRRSERQCFFVQYHGEFPRLFTFSCGRAAEPGPIERANDEC
jgi:hypothetical protein